MRSRPHSRRLHGALAALALAGSASAAPSADPASCSTRSGPTAPLVVELYTSEGCSSCPPADRWLSSLRGTRADVIALAFHVDYWDRLGWVDRYASADWTRRQYELSARSGSRFVYTPQVLLNGGDYRAWPALPARGEASRVALELRRDGDTYLARVTRSVAAPRALSGYWAVTEDGHQSQVRSGENAGATLRHDAVVRELLPVASLGETALRFVPKPANGAATRKVQFVVVDRDTGRPVQAVAVGC